MAGGGDVTPVRALPSRSAGHPHWWGVLAVALALLALVAAISSTDPAATHPRNAALPAAAASDGNTSASTVRGALRQTYTGRFVYPSFDRVVVKAQAKGGTVRAWVRAGGTPSLKLHLACPGGSRAAAGTSSLAVGVPGGSGTCLVSLSAGSAAAAGYTLVVARG